jgi:hypothetical protein
MNVNMGRGAVRELLRRSSGSLGSRRVVGWRRTAAWPCGLFWRALPFTESIRSDVTPYN